MKKITNDKKFSVLMSVYYKENPSFLDICFNSIMKSTILPNQIVLVKDGKLTPELEDVLEDYNKKYPNIFKFIPLEKNVGLGKALQIGLAECDYEIVMRMDTDDICASERFEKQLDYMKKHKDVSVVGGNIAEFNDNVDEELRIKEMPISHEEVIKYSKFRNPLNHMTVCFRKTDVLEVGGYQPLDYLEDNYLWLRMLVAGKKIENIPEILVYARIGNGFTQRRGNKKQVKGWKFLQQYLYENKYISFFEKIRNVIGIYVMVYTPNGFRKFLYNNILRKKGSKE